MTADLWRPPPFTHPDLARWLEIGRGNIWISRAVDPPFGPLSFYECHTAVELREKFWHGNWSVGTAFVWRDLCFIEQVEAGDEWLTIKDGRAFESISWRLIIKAGEFAGTLADLHAATREQCRELEWRTGGHDWWQKR
jgi:hypothetical protein